MKYNDLLINILKENDIDNLRKIGDISEIKSKEIVYIILSDMQDPLSIWKNINEINNDLLYKLIEFDDFFINYQTIYIIDNFFEDDFFDTCYDYGGHEIIKFINAFLRFFNRYNEKKLKQAQKFIFDVNFIYSQYLWTKSLREDYNFILNKIINIFEKILKYKQHHLDKHQLSKVLDLISYVISVLINKTKQNNTDDIRYINHCIIGNLNHLLECLLITKINKNYIRELIKKISELNDKHIKYLICPILKLINKKRKPLNRKTSIMIFNMIERSIKYDGIYIFLECMNGLIPNDIDILFKFLNNDDIYIDIHYMNLDIGIDNGVTELIYNGFKKYFEEPKNCREIDGKLLYLLKYLYKNMWEGDFEKIYKIVINIDIYKETVETMFNEEMNKKKLNTLLENEDDTIKIFYELYTHGPKSLIPMSEVCD